MLSTLGHWIMHEPKEIEHALNFVHKVGTQGDIQLRMIEYMNLGECEFG